MTRLKTWLSGWEQSAAQGLGFLGPLQSKFQFPPNVYMHQTNTKYFLILEVKCTNISILDFSWYCKYWGTCGTHGYRVTAGFGTHPINHQQDQSIVCRCSNFYVKPSHLAESSPSLNVSCQSIARAIKEIAHSPALSESQLISMKKTSREVVFGISPF